jgi:hypothetical protein
LPQRRLRLRQPEGHLHGTVEVDGGGQGGTGLLTTADLGIQRTQGLVNLLSSLHRLGPVWHTCRMNPASINGYTNHRFPAEIISHAVWFYVQFCLN